MRKYLNIPVFIFTTLLTLALLVSCGKAETNVKEYIVEEKAPSQSDTLLDTRTKLKNLMNSYIQDGKYTKLTTLSYSDDEDNYHNKQNGRSRRTYYDENLNALLMGDYDGGFTTINSGYAKKDSETNNMEHYSSLGTSSIDAFFTERDVDYTVLNTNPIDYFDVLGELAITVGTSDNSFWTLDNNVYSYDSGSTLTTTVINDMLLKMFQYFAAPMLLLSDSVNLRYVKIFESAYYPTDSSITSNMLVIKLYTSSMDLISTCYVVKGITQQADIAPMQAVVKGITYDLAVNPDMIQEADKNNELMLSEVAITENNNALSFNVNGHNEPFEAWYGDFVDGKTNFNGVVTLVVKTYNNGTQTVIIGKDTTKLVLKPNDNWKEKNARFAAYFFIEGVPGEWVDMVQHEQLTDYYYVTIASGDKVIFGRMNPATSTNNFDDGVNWNQTNDEPQGYLGNYIYYITGWNKSGSW